MSVLWRETDLGLDVRLMVIPKSSRDEIVGIVDGGEGAVLKVKVRVVPEKGKANLAVVKLLSKALKIPKSTFEIVSGSTNRRKIVRIHGKSENILQCLKTALGLA